MSGQTDRNSNREQEISKISRDLKGLAKGTAGAHHRTSQLSREVEKRKEGNKMPQLSDLRESGAIEQDADMVMFSTGPNIMISPATKWAKAIKVKPMFV